MTYTSFVENFWLLVQLNPSNYTRVTPVQVADLITEGIYEIYRELGPVHWLRSYKDIPCSAGDSLIWIYDNVDVNGIPDFWRWDPNPPTIAGVPVPFLSLGEFDRLNANGGVPGQFIYDAGVHSENDSGGWRSARKIGLQPPLTAAATLRLYYQRLPLPLSRFNDSTAWYSAVEGHAGRTVATTDYPDLPMIHHWTPIYWAGLRFAALGIESKTKLPTADWASLFRAGVDNIRRDLSIDTQANQPQYLQVANFDNCFGL